MIFMLIDLSFVCACEDMKLIAHISVLIRDFRSTYGEQTKQSLGSSLRSTLKIHNCNLKADRMRVKFKNPKRVSRDIKLTSKSSISSQDMSLIFHLRQLCLRCIGGPSTYHKLYTLSRSHVTLIM